MLSEKNKQILLNANKPETNNIPVNKFYVLNKMRLDGFLEHILLRLYAGFHSKILAKQTNYLHQISLITHLGLVNLSTTYNDEDYKVIKITLSHFGKAVMTTLMPHQETRIRKILVHKDKLYHKYSIIFKTLGLSALTSLFAVATWYIIDRNSTPSVALNTFSNIVVIFNVGVMALFAIVYAIYSEHKKEFLEQHTITLRDILSICEKKNGTKQMNCEKQYLIRYYRWQKYMLKNLQDRDISTQGHSIIQKPSEELTTV